MHTADEIAHAVKALKRGDVIAMPTETVYGLAALAIHPQAVEKLHRLKGARENKPYTLQVADVETVMHFANLAEPAQIWAKIFWPGPLTMVLPRTVGVSLPPDVVQNDYIGFRIPDHPVALAVLRGIGQPLAVPSANRSGEAPARTADEVKEIFGGEIEIVLRDIESPAPQPPSTVVRVNHKGYTILREGSLTKAKLESVLPR